MADQSAPLLERSLPPLESGNDPREAFERRLAREILATERFRATLLAAQARIPPTQVGVGLHAGPAIVGNIGSAKREEYTVIGDVVNVASRVEAMNKQLDSRMLVTEEVWRAAGKTQIEPIARDLLRVRGREAAVEVLRLA